MSDEKLFIDGQSVRGKTANDKLFEGVLYTRTDGVRVVLNEQGKYRKLRDLTGVVRTGQLLYEDQLEDLTNEINGIIDNIDIEKVEKGGDNAETQVKDSIGDVVFNSDAGKKAAQPEEDVKQLASTTYDAKKAEAEAGETGGDVAKAQNTLKQFAKQITESKKHILEFMSDSLADELGGEVEGSIESEDADVDSFMDEVDPNVGDNRASDDEAFDYIDPEYTDLNDEDRERAINDVIENVIDDEADEIVKYLYTNYEMSEDDAQLIACEALERVLKGADVSNDINEEVEAEYENAIDEYDGDDDGLLDHLADTFEIPEAAATSMLVECNYNRHDAILKFAEYTCAELKQLR
jgi:hypothetical protein